MVPSNDNLTGGIMAIEEQMTVDERYKYLRMLHARYEDASRTERIRLLEEAVAMTGLNRTYVSHLLSHAGPVRKQRCREREKEYGNEVKHAVRIVAESLDWICPERLQPALGKTAQHLAGFGELQVGDELLAQLEKISISTLTRMLQGMRPEIERLPQRRGKAPTGLARVIPMTRLDWRLDEPGHFEMDLVHHCGAQTTGDYVCTLQMIDVLTGWSERVAVYGRSAKEIVGAFELILSRCPMPILEVHMDNGAEFLNHPLLTFFGDKVSGVKVTRSRPYQKNDNRIVEQKNNTLVRAYLGHVRLDTRTQCTLLNRIYEDMWVYYNLFQPVLRQLSKETESTADGLVRIHRTQDTAQTPLDRLLKTGVLSPAAQDDLLYIHEVTNPHTLRRDIQGRLDKLLATSTY